MKLILYKNKSTNNTLNKDIEKVVEFDGTLRTSTSIITPTITIELTDENKRVVDNESIYVMTGEEKSLGYKSVEDYLYLCNYAYIEDFKRYYFVIDVSTSQKNIYNFKLSCDVLMSYKEDIYKSQGFVSRNATHYNKKLYDDLLEVEENVKRKVSGLSLVANIFKTDSSISFKNTQFDFLSIAVGFFDTYRYILTTAVTPTDTDYNVSYRDKIKNNNDEQLSYLYNSIENNTISSDITPNSAFVKNYIISNSGLKNLAKILNTNDNITSNANQQCIISVISYPFDLYSFKGSYENIRYGSETSSVSAYSSPNIFKEFCVGDYTFTDTLDYFSVYDKIELLLPFYGYVQLEYKQIVNKRLVILYGVNIGSTNGYVRIVDITNGSTNGVEIFYSEIEIGTNVTINFNNVKEYKRNQIINGITTGLSAFNGISNVAMGVASGSVGTAISGTRQIANGIGNSINYYLSNTKNYTSKIGNSINSVAYTDIYLKVTSPVFTNNNDTFTKLYGRPLNEMKTLSELKDSGYTIVKQLKLSSVQATKNEQDNIKELLESGVYL